MTKLTIRRWTEVCTTVTQALFVYNFILKQLHVCSKLDKVLYVFLKITYWGVKKFNSFVICSFRQLADITNLLHYTLLPSLVSHVSPLPSLPLISHKDKICRHWAEGPPCFVSLSLPSHKSSPPTPTQWPYLIIEEVHGVVVKFEWQGLKEGDIISHDLLIREVKLVDNNGVDVVVW